jgi:hypothetical protein
MAESVSARDLRAMMNLVHDGYADEPADGFQPRSWRGCRGWCPAIPSAFSS